MMNPLFALLLIVPATAPRVPRPDMAVVPAGVHEKLYGDSRSSKVRVSRFALDREPVTRRDYLEFVRKNPLWRKSAVKSTSADVKYLSDWSDDLRAGRASELKSPVTNVSWYAATAYCEARGKRLPTVDEWEYAGSASETKADATRDPSFINRLVTMYAGRSAGSRKPVGTGFRNKYGVRDMHELAWEWTADFKPEPARHDAHHDHAAKGHKHDMFCASSAIGAANPSNYPAFMRYAVRAGLNRRTTMETLGFRCAADVA